MGAFCEATFVPGPMLGTAVWGKNQTWSLSPNALASGPSLLPRIGFVAWSWSSSGTDRALVLFRALACGESFRLEADCASQHSLFGLTVKIIFFWSVNSFSGTYILMLPKSLPL